MKVLVLKGLYDVIPAAQAMEAGARGIVLAEDPTESIILAIIKVHHRDTGLNRPDRRARQLCSERAHGVETQSGAGETIAPDLARERADSRHRARTLGQVHEHCREPGISEHTVHNHLSNIYQKLDLINRTDLLMYAIKHGLFDGQ